MGISKFVKFLFKYQNPTYSYPSYADKPNILYFDLNSLLHDCAQFVYAYGSYKNRYTNEQVEYYKKHQEELDLMYGKKLIEMIEDIIGFVKPKQTWIGIDGVCPTAKIQQQRWRRFKSKKESPFDFSSVMISPGTHFMDMVHDTLLQWSKGKSIIYNEKTSFHTPKEAEHKIMEDVMKKSGTYVIYGLDNDLVVLSVLHSNKNLRLFNLKKEVEGEKYYFVDAYQMKNKILFNMGSKASIEDFVLLTFLVGNDFIPSLFGYDVSTSDSLSYLISVVYSSFNHSYKPIYENNVLNYEHLNQFLKHLQSKEEGIYNTPNFDFPHPVIKSSIKNNKLDMKTFNLNYENSLDDNVKSLSFSWYKIVNWNMLYYLEQPCCSFCYYPHYSSPTTTILVNNSPSLLDMEKIYFQSNIPSPFMSNDLQMACILPPSYISVVKNQKLFKDFMTRFPQYFPQDYQFDRLGLTKENSYKEKVILPFIQPSLIYQSYPNEFVTIETDKQFLFQSLFNSELKNRVIQLMKKFNMENVVIEDDKSMFDLVQKNRIETAYGGESKRGSKRAKEILQIINSIPNLSISNYLDIGCNTGENTIEVKKLLKLSQGETFGIDVKSFTGKEIVPLKGFSHQFYDGVHIPFSDNKFDLVTLLQVLHHVEKLEEFMKELARVVKNNGIVILREHDTISEEFNKLIDLEHMLWSANDGVSYKDFMKTYYATYFSKQQLVDLFTRFGFVPVDVPKQLSTNFGATNYYYTAFQLKKFNIQNMYKGALLHVHFSAMVKTRTLLDFIFDEYDYKQINWDSKNKVLSFLKKGNPLQSSMRKEIEQYIQQCWDEHDSFDKIGNLFYEVIKFVDFYPLYLDLIYDEMFQQNIDHVELRLKLGSMFGRNKKMYSIEDELKILLEKQHQFWTSRDNKSICIIAQASKHQAPEKVLAYFDSIQKLLETKPQYKKLIVAFDLVGDESTSKPLSEFQSILNKKYDVPFVLHAGEIKGKKGLDNLKLALQYAVRIGHGHHIVDRVQDETVIPCLELCPISNDVLGNKNLDAYHKIIEAGIPFTINSDDPNKLYDTDLNDNFQYMLDNGFTMEQLEMAVKYSIEYSLTDKKYLFRNKLPSKLFTKNEFRDRVYFDGSQNVYFTDYEKKYQFITSDSGMILLQKFLDKVEKMLHGIKQKIIQKGLNLEEELKLGEEIYFDKPSMKKLGMTWSREDYQRLGFQFYYLKFKSIQRFTETYAMLERAHSMGLLNLSEINAVSLGGGPGFELEAFRVYLQEKSPSIPFTGTVVDLENTWKPCVEELGFSFQQGDFNKKQDVVNAVKNKNIVLFSYVVSHYMKSNTEKIIKDILNVNDKIIILANERHKTMKEYSSLNSIQLGKKSGFVYIINETDYDEKNISVSSLIDEKDQRQVVIYKKLKVKPGVYGTHFPNVPYME